MASPDSCAFTPAAVREFDRVASEERGIPGIELMRRAGGAVFEIARREVPGAARWLVLCGAGNNAGDGYVIARLVRAAGLTVTAVAVGDPRELAGAAAEAFADFSAAGGRTETFSSAALAGADVVIDALFGTGLSRPLTGRWLEVVAAVNAAAVPVIAVDLPSGLCGLTGRALGTAICAQATVTFIARKLGLYLGDAPAHVGQLHLARLGVPDDVLSRATPSLQIFTEDDWRGCLVRRPRASHKGHFGHVLVVGGNHGMGGAAQLAATAALRAGAGLVSVATQPSHAAAMVAARPELMVRGVPGPAELLPLLARATVIAVGPGLGQDDWSLAMLERVLQSELPLVIDADALNLLATRPRRRDNWVLTPHPAEAARLLGSTSAGIQADRLGAVRDLQARYGGVVLLKGAGTLVAGGQATPVLIDRGNPGMATAGMGDVLTGVIAGLVAQFPGGDRLATTACAAWIHACSADAAAHAGERGLTASDVLAGLRVWLNPVP